MLVTKYYIAKNKNLLVDLSDAAGAPTACF